METFLKKSITEITSHLDQLEFDFLVLETDKDEEAFFRIYRTLHLISGFADFLQLSLLKDCLGCVFNHIDSIHGTTQLAKPEAIDFLIDFTHGFQSLANQLTEEKTHQKRIDSQKLQELVSQTMQKLLPHLAVIETEFKPSAVTIPPQKKYHNVSADLYEKISYPPEMKDFFIIEARERLNDMEETIISLENEPDQPSLHNVLSRQLHSLKGNTGILIAVLPTDEMIRLTHPLKFFHDLVHATEDLLMNQLGPEVNLSANEIDILLLTVDRLNELLIRIDKNIPCTPDEQEALDRLIGQLVNDDNDQLPEKTFKSESYSPMFRAFLNTANQCLEAIDLSLKNPAIDWSASIPKPFERAIKTLHKVIGKIEHPDLTIVVQSLKYQLDQTTGIEIEKVERLATQLQSILGAFDTDQTGLPPKKTENQEAVKSSVAPSEGTPSRQESFVRVPQSKVDLIMNLVGELLVTKNGFRILSQDLKNEYGLIKMADAVSQKGLEVARITDKLQAEIMDIRMIPLKTVFSRFPRLIHDLSKSTGKKMKLVIEGGDTQLDKMIVEQLIDPLTHIIRNSADHGIESPEERKKAGKPTEGLISVSAGRQGQFVILKIKDDGRGLQKDKIISKAISKGLIDSSQLESMDTQSIYALVFKPGFSTANQVTSVSGRGVGLDVVQTSLEKLNGIISIDSQEGSGSCLTLQIPLTLAVTRGLMVKVNQNIFVLPLDNVEEIVKTNRENIRQLNQNHGMYQHRKHVLPVIDLSQALGINSPKKVLDQQEQKTNAEGNEQIVCLAIIIDGAQRFALKVSGILQEVEILFKSLGGEFSYIPGISGATILGDGKIVLIINTSTLLLSHERNEHQTKSIL